MKVMRCPHCGEEQRVAGFQLGWLFIGKLPPCHSCREPFVVGKSQWTQRERVTKPAAIDDEYELDDSDGPSVPHGSAAGLAQALAREAAGVGEGSLTAGHAPAQSAWRDRARDRGESFDESDGQAGEPHQGSQRLRRLNQHRGWRRRIPEIREFSSVPPGPRAWGFDWDLTWRGVLVTVVSLAVAGVVAALETETFMTAGIPQASLFVAAIGVCMVISGLMGEDGTLG